MSYRIGFLRISCNHIVTESVDDPSLLIIHHICQSIPLLSWIMSCFLSLSKIVFSQMPYINQSLKHRISNVFETLYHNSQITISLSGEMDFRTIFNNPLPLLLNRILLSLYDFKHYITILIVLYRVCYLSQWHVTSSEDEFGRLTEFTHEIDYQRKKKRSACVI